MVCIRSFAFGPGELIERLGIGMQAVASRAWTVGGTWENGMRYTVVLMCVDRWCCAPYTYTAPQKPVTCEDFKVNETVYFKVRSYGA